jgi:thiol-disulfide isomerase/thioredoxin
VSARPHVRWLKSAFAIAAFQTVLVVLYLRIDRERSAAPEADAGYEPLPPRAAPDIALLALDGTTTMLSASRGRPVLLHFWGTWCGPCKDELPGLLELGEDLERSGKARLVALSLDRDWQPVKAFFGAAVPRAVVRAGAGDAAKAFDVAALPDTYLLHADGSLRGRFGGARDWRSNHLRTKLMKELAR